MIITKCGVCLTQFPLYEGEVLVGCKTTSHVFEGCDGKTYESIRGDKT